MPFTIHDAHVVRPLMSQDPSPLVVLNCNGCGACCTNMGHPRFNRFHDNELWLALPDELKQEVDNHIASLTEMDLGEDCIWFDRNTLQCRHYDFRPQMCRDFEAGSFHCLRIRASHGIVS